MCWSCTSHQTQWWKQLILRWSCFLSAGCRSQISLRDLQVTQAPKNHSGSVKSASLPSVPVFSYFLPPETHFPLFLCNLRCWSAEPSRAVPCHHFPLIKRVCLCKAWYMRGWHTVACLRLWHNCNIHIMLSRSASVRTFLFILRWNHSNSAVTHLICVCFLFICWKFQDLNDSKSAGTLICWWTFRNKTVKYRLSFVSSHFLFINQVWLYERR